MCQRYKLSTVFCLKSLVHRDGMFCVLIVAGSEGA